MTAPHPEDHYEPGIDEEHPATSAARETGAVTAPEVTDAELALIRDELAAGLAVPDISEPADLAIWRAGHAAELREPEAGQ